MKKIFENKELKKLTDELTTEWDRLEEKYQTYENNYKIYKEKYKIYKEKFQDPSNQIKKARYKQYKQWRDNVGTKQDAILDLITYIQEIHDAPNTNKNATFTNREKKILADIELLKVRRKTGLGLSHAFWSKLEKFINHFRKKDKKLTIGVKSASIANKIHQSFFDKSKSGEEPSTNHETSPPSPKNK